MRTVEIDTDALSAEDHAILNTASRHPAAMVKALVAKTTLKGAEEIIVNSGGRVVSSGDSKLVDEFVANKDHLLAYLEAKAEKRAEKVAFVVANSEMTEAHLAKMDEDALDGLVSSIKPKNVHIAAFNSGGAPELDLSILEA